MLFAARAINNWNSLPNVANAATLNDFKILSILINYYVSDFF